jgi:predicted esterase
MKRLWVILFVIPLFAQKPLKYSISFPEITQSNMPVLFLMHGYGNNEKQFNELIEELNNKYLIVSMRAPFKFMAITNRWYEKKNTILMKRKYLLEVLAKVQLYLIS